MSTKAIHWKLRRLGERALRVLARNMSKAKSLSAYEELLLTAVTSYNTTYDRLRVLETERATELRQGHESVAKLGKTLRGWLAIMEVNESIQGFDASEFSSMEVPDDILHDAQVFLDLVAKHAQTLPNADVLTQEISEALTVAKKEWSEAEALRLEYQDLVEENRENADRLQDVLVAFRKTLAQTIGRQSPDYQRLRASRIRRDVYEPGEEQLPEPSASDPSPDASENEEDDDALAS